jgi:sodium/hydrogen antiporter
MSELNIALVVIGGLVLGTGLLSRPIRGTALSLPMLALLTGVALGPAGVGLLHPDHWGSPAMLLEEAARLTLAIGLMGVALRLPPEFPLRSWRALAVLLGLVMPLMGLCSGLLTYWFLDLPLLIALLVGAAVAPTDPIVSTSIVTGQVAEANLPERVRHLLSAESGANDGLAYPLVLLPVLLLTRPADEVWAHWFGRVICASIVAHGITAAPLTKLYGRHQHRSQYTRGPQGE